MNWPQAKLKHVARLGYGESLPREEQANASVPVFGSNGQFSSFSSANTAGPAIIVGRKGSYGKVNWSEEPCFATDTTFFVDHSTTQNDLRWLYWLLQTLELDEGSEEAAVPGLNRETAYSKEVFVPPLSVQRAIADFLDRETARLDALVAAKERVLKHTEEKRHALITRAVTRGINSDASYCDSGTPWLGDIPAHWFQYHLKRALTNVDYGISDAVGNSGSIAVLRMGDIQNGEIDYSNVGFVEEVDESALLQPGDIVFNRTNSLEQIGKTALYRGNDDYHVSFASYLVRFRCGPKVLPEFLNYLLNSSYPTAWGRSEALPAIGQANLNPNRYGYLPIALPPLTEQREIVEYISQFTGRIDALCATTLKTVTLLTERRAALIAAAVTGRIDVERAA